MPPSQANRHQGKDALRISLRSTHRVMLLTVIFPAMSISLSPPAALAQDGDEVELTFDFETDAQGWTVGFVDLPVDYGQSIYEPAHGHGPLTDGLEGGGIFVQGHNRRDDLFMFLKRQVDGLMPDTAYEVSVSMDLATNVPAGAFGIGGSPGESVFVKRGRPPPRQEPPLPDSPYDIGLAYHQERLPRGIAAFTCRFHLRCCGPLGDRSGSSRLIPALMLSRQSSRRNGEPTSSVSAR